jgi:ribosomal protein S27E
MKKKAVTISIPMNAGWLVSFKIQCHRCGNIRMVQSPNGKLSEGWDRCGECDNEQAVKIMRLAQ